MELKAHVLELQSSSTIADLEKKLSSKSSYADDLALELSQARADVALLETGKKGLEEEVIAAAGMGEELQLNSKKLSELDLQLEKTLKELEVAQTKGSKFEKASNAARSDVETLKGETEHLSSQLLLSTDRVQALESDLTLSNTKHSTSSNRCTSLESENTKLITSLEELRGKIVLLSNAQIDLTDKHDESSRALREKEGELQAALQICTAAKDVQKELERVRNELESECKAHLKLVAEVEKFAGELAVGRAEKEEAEQIHSGELSKLQEELYIARTQSTTLSTERDALVAQVAEQINTIQLLRVQVDQAEQRALELEAKTQELQTRVLDAGKADQELEVLKEEMESREEAHRSLSAKFEEDLRISNDRFTVLEGEKGEAITALDGERLALKKLEEQHSEKSSLLEGALENLKAREVELITSREQVGSATSGTVALSEQVESQKLELEELKKSLLAAETAGAGHSSRVEDLEREGAIAALAAVATTGELAILKKSAVEQAKIAAAANTEADKVKKEVGKFKAELDKSVKSSKKSEKELEARKSSQVDLERQVKEAALVLAKEQEERKALLKKQAGTTTDLGGVTVERDQLLKRNATLSGEVERLQASAVDGESSQEERSVALAAAASASALELEALRKEVALATAAKLDAETGWTASKDVVTRGEEALKAQLAELELAQTKSRELQLSIDAAQSEASSAHGVLTTTNTDLSVSLDSLQFRFDALTSSHLASEESLELARRNFKDKEAQLAKVEAGIIAEVEAANATVRDRNIALTAAARRASKSEKELKSIMARGDEKTDEVEKLRSSITRLEGELLRSVGKCDATTSEVSSLTKELEDHASEVEQLKGDLRAQGEETEEAARALEELQGIFSRAQEDLAAKDAELEELRLRHATPVPPSTSSFTNVEGASTSPYDQEYVDSIATQHGLELSEARTAIRALEERIFGAQEATFGLEKTNGDLKAQIGSMVDLLEGEREKTNKIEREVEALRAEKRSDRSSGAAAKVIPPPPKASASKTVVSPPPKVPSPSRPPASTASFLPPTPVPITDSVPSLIVTAPVVERSAAFPPALPPRHESPPLVGVPSSPQPLSSVPRNMAPSQRHARRASLNLLKTRMEDELGFEIGPPSAEEEGKRHGRIAVRGDEYMHCSCCTSDMFVC